jgi:predicted GNAT family acetyltransferase
VDEGEIEEAERYLAFATQRALDDRALCEAGHGVWWGAFVDGRLASVMGLVDAGGGLARYQSVETHPEFRGRGLAGTLVHRVAAYGFDEMGARTLVMVADPEYLAIRIYRSVGFDGTETQTLLEQRDRATT